MFGSNTIEILIGIILVYILVSSICTAVREGIESVLKTRAAYLERGIRELFKNDANLISSFYNHPLINGLFSSDYTPQTLGSKPGLFDRGKNLPSYIPSKNFSKALMDLAARGTATDATNTAGSSPLISLTSIRANVAQLGNPYVQRVLLNAIDTAQGDINKAQANIEDWYNSSMDRVSGWYKRSTQSIVFIIALVVVIGLNVNSIVIANFLSNNDTARKMLVERAATIAKDTSTRTLSYDDASKELHSLGLPIGWEKGWDASGLYTTKVGKPTCLWSGDFLIILGGWLLTALAATLGAPFWFDMLNKVMVIRSTVKPHEKSDEEASQDRQSTTLPGNGTNANNGGGGSPASDAGTDTDNIDGCDVVATDLIGDDQLPASEGGIA